MVCTRAWSGYAKRALAARCGPQSRGMTSMQVEVLKAKIKVCMFDQYGTVVDMQKGLTEAVTPYLKKKGWNGRPDAFAAGGGRRHYESSKIEALLHRDQKPYREIGHRAVRRVLPV